MCPNKGAASTGATPARSIASQCVPDKVEIGEPFNVTAENLLVRPGELLSVRLRSLGETGAAEFIIDRDGDDAMVATNADGMTALLRRLSMDTAREPELLSAQLTVDVLDRVYEDALRAAVILLASAREVAA